jgi:bifunctional UDP-N-acetylglucosamine pyrophosphorylase/glucosamine-1-phosphate N-acetyltransferase
MKLMKAVILAAGEGVRLLPITSNRPKHLISLGGKPILEHCLDALKACGVTEVILVTHYLGDHIRQHFGDGSRFDMKIQYVEQPAVMGTGNAVSLVEKLVGSEFVVVYGDLLFSSQGLANTIQKYVRDKPAGVMAVVPVERPESYGITEIDNEDNLKRIIEKPTPGQAPSNLANAGLYVFSKKIFSEIGKTKKSVRGEWELTDALSLLVSHGQSVKIVRLQKDDWFDIGKPWDLLDANSWVLKRKDHQVKGVVENGAHLIGPVTVENSARIRSGAYIEGPAFIGEGSDVGPNCYIRPFTSLGKNVRIGNAVEIKNSIIMDNTHVGHLSYVGDSVLCTHCNLGAGTITANYRMDGKSVKMVVKDKVADSGRRKLGVILGDNVKTGINALFMPGVKVGNDSWVGPNFTLYRDLPSQSMAMAKQHEDINEKKA